MTEDKEPILQYTSGTFGASEEINLYSDGNIEIIGRGYDPKIDDRIEGSILRRGKVEREWLGSFMGDVKDIISDLDTFYSPGPLSLDGKTETLSMEYENIKKHIQMNNANTNNPDNLDIRKIGKVKDFMEKLAKICPIQERK